MERSYRIRTNIGVDQSISINLKQDVDLYEILTLKLNQKNLYKMHSADYGVIVGRVLANDAFGIPNAKVTVFIPLSEKDELRRDIKNIYPYKSVTDYDKLNVKFNTLPNYKKFACHQEVGSFPKKQLVLDDDSILEMYDKYYKYTTVTNKAGDYMIFGVPTGSQILHVDIDLSDIGILSQEPRDFIYKGYTIDMFESPTQFKKSTNLDNLAQIYTENTSVTVYPLWGDKNTNEIAITRKDINIQYKFETTCVFMGSVVTDSNSNSVSNNCIPDKFVGDLSQLTPSKGNIEMIRKTIDDRIEEYPIKGNQLIDGDGTWCYQIPMNLDYVGMDEYGNIVPTDNPSKGIPTRARVRFRVTLDESGEDALTRHKARYLIPNNPDLNEDSIAPYVDKGVLDNDSYYEFGTLTPDECFRDLYWNKVYSIKSYIPRLQVSAHEKSENYLAIKGVNKRDAKDKNPFPFNKLNLNTSVPVYYLLEAISRANKGIAGFWRYLKSYSVPYSIDAVREEIVEELDGIGLDFYNDWINGCLYFPSWFWRIKQKKKYKKGESVYESDFCECGGKEIDNKLFLYNNCSLVYSNEDLVIRDKWEIDDDTYDLYAPFNSMFTSISFGSNQFESGIIKRKKNKDGVEVFYYSFGNKIDGTNEQYRYARLFSTDIILLGSLKECDIDGIPQISYSIPSTTANIPPFGRYKTTDSNGDVESPDYEEYEDNIISYNGMNWGQHWFDNGIDSEKGYNYKFGTGLFFSFSSYSVIHKRDWALTLVGKSVGGLFSIPIIVTNQIFNWGSTLFGSLMTIVGNKRIDIVPFSDIKTCVNAERISELGVTLDTDYKISYTKENGKEVSITSEMDGLITKRELEDVDSRALFATLNHNKLIGIKENETTGYKTYNLTYFYPTNFDGRLERTAPMYTNYVTFDERNKDYLDFRLGSNDTINISTTRAIVSNEYGNFGGKRNRDTQGGDSYNVNDGSVTFNNIIPRRIRHFYGQDDYKNNKAFPVMGLVESGHYDYIFPLYNNSFYFYFGINQGSTAIDKFYEQFYSKCAEEKSSKFLISTSFTAATECNPTDGELMVYVEEIEIPYSIQLIKNGVVISAKRNMHVYDSYFNGLQNGKYTIKVIDAFGSEMTEDIIINYQKISLKTNVLRGIQTEYRNQSKNAICNNNYHAQLQFESYTLYGEEKPITSINRVNIVDNKGIYDLGDGIYFEISARDGRNFLDYHICGGALGTEFESGNIMKICSPGKYDIKIYEKCSNGLISNNISESTVTITDVKAMELYINNVPLKYIVGINESQITDYQSLLPYSEEQIPYNEFFHNGGEKVTDVSNTSISGWFGVHNPLAYSSLFSMSLNTANGNTEEEKQYIENCLNIWLDEPDVSTNLDIIERKFEYMFALSKAAYVTHGGNNSFKARIEGGSGENLLRSASPVYLMFKEDNDEEAGIFNSFITGENDEVKCHEASPNIVSENYSKVKSDGYPESFEISGYGFNPKYADKVNTAGNYFACFSNNANIVQIDETSCEQCENCKPYQVIPYKAHDLYKYDDSDETKKLCLYGEEDGILSKVYNQHRYFRTEFIDRRFDYDFVYITGRKPDHYDVYDFEKEETWNMARISALTYNGIEMAYDGQKNIISKAAAAEYTYDKNNATIQLREGFIRKKFYETKLYYGDNKYIELINGYDYTGFTGRAYYLKDGTNVSLDNYHVESSDSPVVSNSGHFGLDVNNGNVMYPTLRRINFYRIPYGEKYTFKNVSCSYDGIEIKKTTDSITAKAVPGEVVTHTVESGELVKLVCNDFETDCTGGKYNVFYKSRTNGATCTMESNSIKELKFKIDSSSNSKIGDIGVRTIPDGTDHTNLKDIKTANSYSTVKGILTGNTSSVVTKEGDIYNAARAWNTDYKFLNIVFDMDYANQENDSLMKKIKVINASTIFNVNSFVFVYEKYEVVSDSFVIPAQQNNTQEGGAENTNGNNGTRASNDQTSSIRRNYTVFQFVDQNKFLFNCMDSMCFKISMDNDGIKETADYFLTDSNVSIIEKTESTIKVGVKWSRHSVLLKENDTAPNKKATVKVYMKIRNNIKAQTGEGNLVFGFGFKIEGNSKTMTFLNEGEM